MVPFIYIPSYGQINLGMSRSLSLYTIVIAQAVSIVGRLLAAYIASRIGVMIPWLISGALSAVMCLAWAGIHDTASFIAYAALYGKLNPKRNERTPGLLEILTVDRRLQWPSYTPTTQHLPCCLPGPEGAWGSTWDGSSHWCYSLPHRKSYSWSAYPRQRTQLSRTTTVQWLRHADWSWATGVFMDDAGQA
jgi:hypothetical protein